MQCVIQRNGQIYIHRIDVSELPVGRGKLASLIDSSVVVGSLATSVTDPWTLLCGASGGCYALIGAHFAKIIMVCPLTVIYFKLKTHLSQ